MSSQIGGLMKEGKKEEAEKIRALVAGKKETIKTLEGEVMRGDDPPGTAL